MEAKFSGKAVVLFIIGSFGLFAGFVGWFYSNSLFAEYEKYKIVFPASVVGLYEGSFVTYNGVQVGKVVKMSIDPEQDNKVSVIALIDAVIKPKQDTCATLSMRGITGYMTVELSGGSTASPMLEKVDGYYVIKHQPSLLDMVTNNGAQLLEKLEKIMTSMHGTLSEINKPLLAVINEVQTSLPGLFDKVEGILNVLAKESDTLDSARIAVEALQNFAVRLDRNGIMGVMSSAHAL